MNTEWQLLVLTPISLLRDRLEEAMSQARVLGCQPLDNSHSIYSTFIKLPFRPPIARKMSLPSMCPVPPPPAGCLDDGTWVQAYLTSHSMGPKSRYYGYLLWSIVGGITLLFTFAHLLNLREGVFGALGITLLLRLGPKKFTWTCNPVVR